MNTSLKFVQTINAPASLVYRAFTNATALREWLCDTATVESKVGGRLFLAWNSGYCTSGEYVKLLADREVSFNWAGRDDPTPTNVKVHIDGLDSGITTLSLEHSGIESSPQWAKSTDEISRGWNAGLKNLISVLENGPDLRIINRPMLGVMFGDFNKKHAEELRVPVTEGLRIDGVVDGMGAQKSGLMKDDVIIAVDGKPTYDFATITNILQGSEAGNHIDITFYRGPNKKRLSMELSRRPLLEIPPTVQAFGDTLRKLNNQTDEELKQALRGVSDMEAAFKPKPGEWSVKEVLAHLIHAERDKHGYFGELVFSQERVSDGYSDNLPARISATVAVYQTIDALLEEFRRCEMETVYIISNLPEEFHANRASFWRLAFNALQYPIHTREHMRQILDCIEAARK